MSAARRQLFGGALILVGVLLVVLLVVHNTRSSSPTTSPPPTSPPPTTAAPSASASRAGTDQAAAFEATIEALASAQEKVDAVAADAAKRVRGLRAGLTATQVLYRAEVAVRKAQSYPPDCAAIAAKAQPVASAVTGATAATAAVTADQSQVRTQQASILARLATARTQFEAAAGPLPVASPSGSAPATGTRPPTASDSATLVSGQDVSAAIASYQSLVGLAQQAPRNVDGSVASAAALLTKYRSIQVRAQVLVDRCHPASASPTASA